MRWRWLGLVLVAGLIGPAAARAQTAASPCRSVTHEGRAYTVCEVDLSRHLVRVFWKRADGADYGQLSALPRSGERAGPLVFATNGGMYDRAYRPVGLYVENGRELVAANTRSGPGNFHLKPNGIFFVSAGSAGVLDTESFLRQRPKVDFATQSGPMLVINGRLHPRFGRAELSRKYRDGVGARDSRTLLFAISDEEVSLAEFGRLFRDTLACPNALFLDGGSVPTLYVPGGRGGNFLPMGPMIGVYARGKS